MICFLLADCTGKYAGTFLLPTKSKCPLLKKTSAGVSKIDDFCHLRVPDGDQGFKVMCVRIQCAESGCTENFRWPVSFGGDFPIRGRGASAESKNVLPEKFSAKVSKKLKSGH